MRHVLVVEDDANSSVMLLDALGASGFSVVHAEDGEQALEYLRTSVPDLIVSDILMPKMDGFALCRAVRSDERLGTVPFVFYTATYIDAADEALAMSLGADRFLVKPMEIDQFVRVVREVIDTSGAGRPRTVGADPDIVDSLEAMHAARLNAKLMQKIDELSAERRALQLSEARFRDFANTAADWFWESNDRLSLSYASRYADRLIGTSLADFLAQGAAAKTSLDTVGARQAPGALLAAREPFREWEVEFTDPDGNLRMLRVNGRPVHDADGRFLGYRGVCRDATEAVALVRKISHDAVHDALTGLFNRREFNQRLMQTCENNRRYGTSSQVCFLDLDQFKVINDTAGHLAGDAMLSSIAKLLGSRLRTRDTLARLGGDEFGIILEHCPIEKAIEVGESLVSVVKDFQFVWKGRTFNAGLSVGIASIDKDVADHVELLSRADVACYAAKESGRNRVTVYDASGRGNVRHAEMFRATEISEALENQRGVLYAQPIIPLHSAAGPLHVELLMRLHDGDGGLVMPGDFIPAAERYGRMGDLDHWVIFEAIHHSYEAFSAIPEAVMCVNLSGTAFADPRFLDFLAAEIRNAGVDPRRFCFEITETAAINNLEAAAVSIQTIRDLGCQFALDDFGSGACSFTYLKMLPVDVVKIDGSFVRDVLTDSIDHALVSSIAGIASVMGIRTVAEMVENSEILQLLQGIGVDYAQGYAIAKPMTIEAACRDYRDFAVR